MLSVFNPDLYTKVSALKKVDFHLWTFLWKTNKLTCDLSFLHGEGNDQTEGTEHGLHPVHGADGIVGGLKPEPERRCVSVGMLGTLGDEPERGRRRNHSMMKTERDDTLVSWGFKPVWYMLDSCTYADVKPTEAHLDFKFRTKKAITSSKHFQTSRLFCSESVDQIWFSFFLPRKKSKQTKKHH